MKSGPGADHDLVIPIPIGHLCGVAGGVGCPSAPETGKDRHGEYAFATRRRRAVPRHGRAGGGQQAESAWPSGGLDGSRPAFGPGAASRQGRGGAGAGRRAHRLHRRAGPRLLARGNRRPLCGSLRGRGPAGANRSDDRLLGRLQPGLPGACSTPATGWRSPHPAIRPIATSWRRSASRWWRSRSRARAYLHAAHLATTHRERPLKGVLFASPANPTGALIPPASWRRWSTPAAELDIAVISDEIYHRLAYAAPRRDRARLRRPA